MSRALLRTPLILVLCATATAQTTRTNKARTPPKSNATRVATDPEAERIRNERRVQAQSLLISLAADAASYKDQKLRARTQARIADLLWDSDRDKARTLFRKAWDAAEIADEETNRRKMEETEQREDASLTNEVLRMASRRDRALSEEFLAKQKAEVAQEASAETDNARHKPQDIPERVKQRLSIARNLLNTDVKRAIQVADPALVSITWGGVEFLSSLRPKDRVAADQRYAAMLTMASGDVQADANTVSWLSSYLFSPQTFVTVHDNGAVFVAQVGEERRVERTSAASTDDAELRMAFFRMAAEILLRPMQASPRSRQNQRTAASYGTYLVIKRLLPEFEQFAPPQMTESLRAQMNALSSTMPQLTRENDDDAVREGIRPRPRQKREDREKAILDKIDQAKTSDERDELYLNLALLYSQDGDLRARDYVDKIEDTEVRKNVRAWLDAVMITGAVDKKDVDKILELVRTGEISRLRKVWALAQAAKLLAKTDHDRSLAVIEEAAAEARRIDGSDADRPRAMMAVGNALLITDRSKSWDATYDGVKAANSAESFTGEDGELRIVLRTKDSGGVEGLDVPEFDVAGIFNELAHDDYNRAVELARGFEREAPRANAVIAIARAVLEEKTK
jgi:hypothetical protein